MPFEILRNDITKMKVDAIVNSTSPIPSIGGGADQIINQVAGPDLFLERQAFGIIDISKAIITKGYNLPSKYVIHVVGPIYDDGLHHEKEYLYQTYINALNLAIKSNIKTIAFPLISSGLFRFPRGEALEIALDTIKSFLNDHDMMIYLLVYDEASYQISLDRFISVKSYLDDYSSSEDLDSNQISAYHKEINYDSEIEFHRLIIDRSIEDVIDQLDETFSEKLFRLIDERALDDIYVYKKANIDRKLFSKIKSKDDYQPSKMTVIAFSIALELNLDETKDLLTRAGYAFSPSSKFDLIIQYFIENDSYDLYEINSVLFAFEQKTIGGLD